VSGVRAPKSVIIALTKTTAVSNRLVSFDITGAMARGFACLVLCLASVGCSGNDSKDEKMGSRLGSDLPEGPGAFLADFDSSSDFFTRMAAPAPGLETSPHGVVQIFYSANIEPVIAAESFVVPKGTVAIKTQDQSDDGVTDNIMVMIKLGPGEGASSGDWLFERYWGDGTLDVSGGSSLGFCASCHNAFPETDGLGGTTLND
jgi:hypothetical protein